MHLFQLSAFLDICSAQNLGYHMLNLTKHTLQKMESLFTELGYVIRYEKGTFNSGYCLVENRKIVIINKFYETEGRIEVLREILKSLDFEPDFLSEKGKKFLKQVKGEPFTEEENQEE
jgi:hypothetical protein